jgi:uncharacterized protein (DUF362 family)
MTNKYLARVSSSNNLKRELSTSLDHVAWLNDLKSDSTVFVKPNFTFPVYRKGVTTNPEVLRELLSQLRGKAKRVIVGESDGANRSFTADQAFEGHGILKICKDLGIELVNLSSLPSTIVEETIQGTRVKVRLPNLLLNEIDYFVSVPVLKVHAMTTVTLGMKNLWGCHPDTMRCLEHSNLGYKLTLITKKLNPKLIVIDGSFALDGHGPMYGTPKETKLIIAANNPVVSDSLGANIMGIPPEAVEHIMIAEKEGLGTTNLSKVIMPSDWSQYKMQFHVERTFVDKMSMLLFKSELLAKIVMDSPLKPAIYGVVAKFRNSDEKKVVSEIEARNYNSKKKTM